MELNLKKNYAHISDKELVDRIISDPSDEEAAVYLVYKRYHSLCVAVCLKTLGNIEYLDQLQSELFMLLKGKKQDWHALRTFQWRSTLGGWLSVTTYNLSLELKKTLIENNGYNASLDEGWNLENEKPRTIEIPVDDEPQRERRNQMLMLQEAIQMLNNVDQRFVVMHRLYGYNSKEVALLLMEYWERNQIIRYNNKKEPVIPDSGYIDNLFKRGYDKVKQIYELLDK